MQRVAHVQQPLVRLAYALVRSVGQPGGGQGPQHRHVPEAAAGLLEVGLEQVGRVAEGLAALVDRREQLGEPFAGVAAPGVQQRGSGRLDQLGVTGHDPQVEQPDPGAQLLAGDLGALGRRPDRVVEPDTGVPQGIPQPFGQGVDRGSSPYRRARAPGRCPTVDRARAGPGCRRWPGPPRWPVRRPRRRAPPAPPRRNSVTKRRRSGPAVADHPDRIATLRRSLVRSRFRARPARARPSVRGRCRPPERTRPCRHRCGRSERSSPGRR